MFVMDILWIGSVLFIITISEAVPIRESTANETTLKLVHVIFRHGDRNPGKSQLYPSNAYYDEMHYYPYGYGQLTNNGKIRMYELGKIIRKRYNNFLGSQWNMNVLDIRSTDYNRTKMSAQLMTAGLWPPRRINIWNPVFRWQPIPYNYERAENDELLSPWLACSTVNTLISALLESTELGNYMSERYNETLHILSENTGLEMSYLQAFRLYLGFSIQDELNMPLEEWTSSVYPEPLHSFVIDYYHIRTNTTELKKIISGYLIKQIIENTENQINGTLTPNGRKMFIYSGHEANIATLLLSLQATKVVDVPPYGSFIIIETHKIDAVYGIKLYYQDYKNDDPQELQITGCDKFCPFDDFVTLFTDILPTSTSECYGV
ncbi:venom acid phosphatase Acph-1 isoform X1 [Dendroctonus ponderosae]|uniref:venom acid phosphatase Acph-1 isoform X1 n=1 Tax=Dendroctonus ponderosae TaxID=77166 RepID=UPI0020361780|nr:venom acid phosphatase Acph-1 isoform X1 [Dendroctonus ponderosae]